MPNPTVRREKLIIYNHEEQGAETQTEMYRSYRANEDVSEMVFHRASLNRVTLSVWHLVYDASGAFIHGPHEKYRFPGYEGAWPPAGYSRTGN